MRTRRIAGTSLLAAGLMLGTSGCGLAYLMAGARQNAVSSSGSGCSGWTTGGMTSGGAPTPLAAVQKAASQQNEPTEGWSNLDGTNPADATGLTFASGPFTVHVVKLPDGTWFADTGSSCGASFATASAAPGSPAAP